MGRIDLRVLCSKCGKEPDTGFLLMQEEVKDDDEVACGSCEGVLVVTRMEEMNRVEIRTVGEIRRAMLSGPRSVMEVWH
jgi:DNA-directed RNA polymerase subunit RPC12/RpoP